MGFFSKLWKKASSKSNKTKADKEQQRYHDHHHHHHHHHHQPRGSHSAAPDSRGHDLFQGYMNGSASNDAVLFQASLAALNVSEERRAQTGRSGHGALPPEISTYWHLEDTPSATYWPLPTDFPQPPPPQQQHRPRHPEYQPLPRSARMQTDASNYRYEAPAPSPAPVPASNSINANYHHSNQGFGTAQSQNSVPITRQNAVRENRPPPAPNSRRANGRGHSSNRSTSRRAHRLQRQTSSESIRENAQHWLTSPSPAGRPTGIGAAPGVPVGLNEPLPLPQPVLGRAKDSLRVRHKTPLQTRQDEERKRRAQEDDESELGVFSAEHIRQLKRRGIFPPPPSNPSSSSR